MTASHLKTEIAPAPKRRHVKHTPGNRQRPTLAKLAVPQHAMEALGGKGDIAPTNSRPWH
jgi:hypothetical protein